MYHQIVVSLTCKPSRFRAAHVAHYKIRRLLSGTASVTSLSESQCHDIAQGVEKDGFCATTEPLLSKETCEQLNARIPSLFRGEFETKVYPDEWHWR